MERKRLVIEMKDPKVESNPEAEDVPSFFKFLADDSLDCLPICSAFVKNYMDGNYPENPFLVKTESDQSWTVEIARVGPKLCFVNGWLAFVKDNKLKTGDFIVFWLIDDSTFQVAMYGPSCCEKLSNQRTADQRCKGGHESHGKKKPNVEYEISGGSAPESPPWYSRVISKSHQYQVPLTTSFTRKIGIASKRKVVLRDEKGKRWEVGGALMNCSYYLTKGWLDFSRANKVEVGDTCVFTFQTEYTDILDVKVLKKPKRKRGKPKGIR